MFELEVLHTINSTAESKPATNVAQPQPVEQSDVLRTTTSPVPTTGLPQTKPEAIPTTTSSVPTTGAPQTKPELIHTRTTSAPATRATKSQPGVLHTGTTPSPTTNVPHTKSVVQPEGLTRHGSQGSRSILLKGQMRYIEAMQAVIFLCSPV